METPVPADLEPLMTANRERLKRMVRLRLDQRLQARVDASDVVQEAFVEATQRKDEFCRDQNCPGFVWLRFITLQKVAQLHRTHLGVQARAVGKEKRYVENDLSASSVVMAQQMAASEHGPLSSLALSEQKEKLMTALEAMKERDREIIALRHFEMLSNLEVATVLEVKEDTAYRRYVRALSRLRELLHAAD